MKTITILPTGEVQFLGDTPPVDLPLGPSVRLRVSTIRPVRFLKRMAFVFFRTVFGETGRVAAFTRTWSGPWRAVILATRQSAVFEKRAEAIRWEEQTLNDS